MELLSFYNKFSEVLHCVMERLKRHVCHLQGRWSEVKEKERAKEKMTLCLYECLKAAGLQRHYAR